MPITYYTEDEVKKMQEALRSQILSILHDEQYAAKENVAKSAIYQLRVKILELPLPNVRYHL